MIDKLSPADAKWVAKAREDFIQRVDGKEIAALRARVAKLEAALNAIRNDAECGQCEADIIGLIDAALQEPPR